MTDPVPERYIKPVITNPILKGFNPDPSICRVGDDYYIATSTFEWYPGVQIHHSRDLENWQLAHRPLDRPDLLNMVGLPDSCGVWAPCLTWHDGLFYLVYTVVRRFDGNFKDTHNYLTTCKTIDGDWSEPVYLNSSGFDGSIFHADDGRKWYLSMIWDHRPDRSFFRGIVLQEYSPKEKLLVGKSRIIFDGTELDCTEGPHLYQFDDDFYLVTAEGGTGYEHAVSMARSKSIWGPYEVDPDGPVITAANHPANPIQRSGHGDLVETQDGRLYLVHLGSRPMRGEKKSPMGRESCIQEIERNSDGWFRLKAGGNVPQLHVPSPGLEHFEVQPEISDDNFESPELNPVYQWLRTPWPEQFYNLRERPGFLRLYGMESPGSHHYQALIARRQVDFSFDAETTLEFEPEHFQQMAGLVFYYNASKFHYLYISRDDEVGKHIAIMSCEAELSLDATFPGYESRVPLPEGQSVSLRLEVRNDRATFTWSLDGKNWKTLPPVLDAGLLCDESGKGEGAQFTGNFVGMCCQDIVGTRKFADFSNFSYHGID